MTKLKLTYLFILLGCLSMFSCKSDDEIITPFPVFTEQDMDLVHGTDSLTWLLTELSLSEEYSPTLEPSCLEDDLLTFYPGQEDAKVTLGEIDCSNDELTLADYGLEIYFDNSSVDPCCRSAIRARLSFDYDNLTGGGPLVLLQAYQLLEATTDRLIFVLSAGDNVIIEDYRDYEYYFVLERVN